MINKELKSTINFLIERSKQTVISFNEEKEFFFEILNQKKEYLKKFKKEIYKNWYEFNLKNHKKLIPKSYTSFLLEHFHEFYMNYFKNFYGLDVQSIKLISIERISDKDIYFEYKYYIIPEIEEIYKKTLDELKDQLYGILFPFGFLFFATSIFGMIMRSIIKKNLFIVLEAAILKQENNRNYIHFLIIGRDSRDEQFKYYFYKDLYYFLRPFKGTPESYYEKLLVGRERLYQLALKEYPHVKTRFLDLFYYFYKKCVILQNISPILDFLNFVCSRVEDSIFTKEEIIKKNLLNHLEYTIGEKNAILRIFKFIDRESTLYSTFQANNLPSEKSQFNLFLLFIKYYFSSGLEGLEVGNLLFFPEIFKRKINQVNTNGHHRKIDSKTINNINNFMNYFSKLFDNEHEIEFIFQKITDTKVFNLNNELLKAFLNSLNKSVITFIEKENKELSDEENTIKFTFKGVISDLCRILYVLIDKIFIRDSPDEASKNFIDPRSRYIGKNIALRVLELFFFQALNISDDLWPDYLISLNKVNILRELKENIVIPEQCFYSVNELTSIMLFHNIQSFIKPQYFEESLIDKIIIPFNDFILHIKNSVQNSSNEIEVYEALHEFLLEGVTDKELTKRVKTACKLLAPFWKHVE
ncbi:MAG: hypothetical protein ACTSXH_16935 [Promethearchaeota archaeon]